MKLQPEAIDLGRKLVDKLLASDRDDFLARWIAHDVAAKITAASRPDATDQDRAVCAAAIYELWEHRNDLPPQGRPFRDIEQIVETIRTLDPLVRRTAYFHERAKPEGEAETWLRHAEAIDSAARALIVHCLEQAAASVGAEAKSWAELADAAGLPSPEFEPVRILFGMEQRSDAEIRAEQLKYLLRLLAAYRKTSLEVGKVLRAELTSLGPMPKRKPSSDPWKNARQRRIAKATRSGSRSA